jgi:3-oxoisoapionate kinase
MTRLISYYGDDFTGSTDVLEALSLHGIRTVLFTRQPTPGEFAPFTDYDAIGLAGTSRSETPEWMDQNLPERFAWLKALGARYCHYKVCSTFDSSPAIGSIGRAAEIGTRIFEQKVVPLIVGAPQLRRYTFAGNLFAAYQGDIYRIDRHPVMSRHPVTPMHEADLRLHLAQQTTLPVSLMTGDWPAAGLALIDVHDAPTQRRAGELIAALPRAASPFIIGSSGVEYALVASGERPRASFPSLGRVDRMMAISGSVSPTTERQIRHSLAHGFEGLAIDLLRLAGEGRAGAIAETVDRALALLREGRSVLAYTALGNASNAGARLAGIPEARRRIGESLGRILGDVLLRSGIRRAAIAGGDSSSHALGQLDVHALTMRMPIEAAPGSPVCVAHSAVATLDGLELALKGGQLGGDNYFVQLRDGSP